MIGPERPTTLIVLAGISATIAKLFESKITKLCENRRQFIFLPMPRYCWYDHDYVRDLYSQFLITLKTIVPLDRANEHPPTEFIGVLLIYMRYGGRDPQLLLDAFGVETLVAPVDISEFTLHEGVSFNRARRLRNLVVERMRKVIRTGEVALVEIGRQIRSNANKTPLLLPFQNFGGQELIALRDKLGAATSSKCPQRAIQLATERFEASTQRVRHDNDRFMSFSNSDGLIFRRPAALHGYNWNIGDGHPDHCYVRSRLRFGACFRPSFHYDCVKEKGTLPIEWKSCHSQLVDLPKSRSHVNIAPNDYIR